MAQRPQLAHPAHKPRVVPLQIARRGLSQLGLAQLLVHALAERLDALANLGLLQRGRPVGEPRLQLLELHPLHLLAPRRDGHVVLVGGAQLHKIDAGNRIPAADAAACTRANSSHSHRQ